MHALSCRDNGIATELTTLNSNRHMRDTMLGNVRIFESIVRFGLAQIRYETLPSSAAAPIWPEGVTDDPDAGAYAVARPTPPPAAATSPDRDAPGR